MSEETKNNNNEKDINRYFILDGKVEESSIKKVVESIINVNNHDDEKAKTNNSYKRTPIKLIVNTYGGSLYEANFLIGVMEISQTPIHTYCFGKAMSAGFYIFIAGHERYATPLATFMYHDGSIGLYSSIEGLKSSLEWQEKLRDRYDEYILSATKLPKSLMDEKKRVKEDLYLTASEAQVYGIVDNILPFKKYNK